MTHKRTAGLSAFASSVLALALGALGFAGLVLVGCKAYDPPPFNPRQMQNLERALAQQNPPADMRPLPTTVESQFLDPKGTVRPRTQLRQPSFSYQSPTTLPTVRRISLQDVLHLAAVNSLDVKVAAYQPAIDANRITEANARFDPSWVSRVQYQNSDIVNPSLSDPTLNPLVNPIAFRQLTVSMSLEQELPYGGKASLGYQITRSDRSFKNVPSNFVNPFYQNELTLQITQPLLQNFGRDINRARIDIAVDTHRISLLDFRLALEKNVAEIERAYWQLAQAERDLRIQELLLARTWEMANTLFTRTGQNVSNVEISQANSQLATRYLQISTTRANLLKLSEQIKSLVNDPDMPVSSPAIILPLDAPLDEPIVFDPKEQIDTAMEYRAELAQQILRINSAEVTRRAAKVNLLPQLNLTGSFGLPGVGGSVHDAFEDEKKLFHLLDYSIGFEFNVPLGNREARAIYQRTLLQRMQAVTQYRNLIEKITAEVKSALHDLTSSWEELRAARSARLASTLALSLYENRLQQGIDEIRPERVQLRLQLQADVAAAERAESEALANYNVAVSALERAKGTILVYNNIAMQEQAAPYGSRPGK